MRRCTKCLYDKDDGQFKRTTAHGKPVIRSWCADCLRDYYKEYAKLRRVKQRARLKAPFTFCG